jgi:large subunit ribosomal protein L30
MNTLEIKLVKSPIGAKPKHREIARQLGLTKMNKTVIQPDNAAVKGLVNKISHLVQCKESV